MDDAELELARMQRLIEVLDKLTKEGLSQQEVARQAGMPPQYLSDIKKGRRPLTELVARRLASVAGVSSDWLAVSAPKQAQYVTACTLPLFKYPVEGDPRNHDQWKGAVIEVSGTAAGKLPFHRWPYVLEYGAKEDFRKRLQAGDLILVSQTVNTAAQIQVVKSKGKFWLARPQPDGQWERVANGQRLPKSTKTAGHCLGVIWSSLQPPSSSSSAPD